MVKSEIKKMATLDSREVAKMLEKEHSNLLKDITRYAEYFNEVEINLVEYFQKNHYIIKYG